MTVRGRLLAGCTQKTLSSVKNAAKSRIYELT